MAINQRRETVAWRSHYRARPSRHAERQGPPIRLRSQFESEKAGLTLGSDTFSVGANVLRGGGILVDFSPSFSHLASL